MLRFHRYGIPHRGLLPAPRRQGVRAGRAHRAFSANEGRDQRLHRGRARGGRPGSSSRSNRSKSMGSSSRRSATAANARTSGDTEAPSIEPTAAGRRGPASLCITRPKFRRGRHRCMPAAQAGCGKGGGRRTEGKVELLPGCRACASSIADPIEKIGDSYRQLFREFSEKGLGAACRSAKSTSSARARSCRARRRVSARGSSCL